jgi:hypothetical protein
MWFQRLNLCFVSALSLAFAAQAAIAGESIISPEPIGGTDLNQALLPPPGLYGGLGAIAPPTVDPHFTDTNGRNLPLSQDVRAKSFIGALGGLYVYPWQVFGGTLASSLQVSVWSVSLAPNAPPNNNYTERSGFGDIYSDAFFWSKNIGLWTNPLRGIVALHDQSDRLP